MTLLSFQELLQPTVVEVVSPVNPIVEVVTHVNSIVEVVSAGPQGTQGPNSIGGYGFEINALAAGDLLVFGGSAWENSNKTVLTDGGNF